MAPISRAAAYEGYFLSADLKREFFEGSADGEQDLMDPANVLIYKNGGSTLNSWTAIVGKKLSDEVSTGVILQRGELDRRIRASEATVPVNQADWEHYEFFAG